MFTVPGSFACQITDRCTDLLIMAPNELDCGFCSLEIMPDDDDFFLIVDFQ